MEELLVEGTIERIIFENNNNDYRVFLLSTSEKSIVCTGYILNLNIGDNMKLYGEYIKHRSYGMQFNVKTYLKSIPTSIDGLERYLSSGVIKGIGKQLAKKIVNTFKEDTYKVIESKPEKLTKIKGISLKKAKEISEVFTKQENVRDIMIFLQQHGISPALSMSIYKKYQHRTVDIITTNPYKLADDVFRIGFKTADAIAERLGIEKTSPFRIKAGLKFALLEAANNGHVHYPKDLLFSYTLDLLNIQALDLESEFLELVKDNIIYVRKFNDIDVAYLNFFYYAESFCAKKLIELSQNTQQKTESTLRNIEALEIENNIKLADKQVEAIVEAVNQGVMVITGGPGTGKTTIINTLIGVFEKLGLTYTLTAPTGKAAKRMQEATGTEAKTLHRLLEIVFLNEESLNQYFGRNEDNPLETDAIILDESSMIDLLLLKSFLSAVKDDTKVIFVGDVDQLPSVGAGNVLHDIIKSNLIKTVKLVEVFRQATKSDIIMNAHKINRGENPNLDSKLGDFFFIPRVYPEDAMVAITELIKTRLPNYKNYDVLKDIQILTPTKKHLLGVQNLNTVLQSVLNPKSESKNEIEFRNQIFRVRDKVIQIKNNYSITWVQYENNKRTNEGTGIFNGDEGIIVDIKDNKLTVCFEDNKYVIYEPNQLEELEISYAITVHKSQGSEYKVVLIPILHGSPLLYTRNLLYTAVTRAKEICIIIGSEQEIYQMVKNKREKSRYSALDTRLNELYNVLKSK